METLNLNITVQKKNFAELTPEEALLVEQAKAATFNSYAPYSHFSVGAALLLQDGTIIPGCNQENCAYTNGLCAERSALFAAGARHPNITPVSLCIAARDVHGHFTPRPVAPCGTCRQVMLEVEERYQSPLRVLLYGTEGIYLISSARDLMPLSFDSSFLN